MYTKDNINKSTKVNLKKLQKVENIIDYLAVENNTYEQVLELEIHKTDSIIQRNAKKLQTISQEQEKMIQESIKKQSESNWHILNTQSKSNKSLAILLEEMHLDASEKQMVDKARAKLKDTIQELKEVSHKNNVLLQNNVDFFHLIMSTFEEKEDRYSIFSNNQPSKKKNVQKSLFLDMQA